MAYRTAFRIYGNFIRDKGILTATLADTYLQMITNWNKEQIKDMFYEYGIDLLKSELSGWQKAGKSNVCRALTELIIEKEMPAWRMK